MIIYQERGRKKKYNHRREECAAVQGTSGQSASTESGHFGPYHLPKGLVDQNDTQFRNNNKEPHPWHSPASQLSHESQLRLSHTCLFFFFISCISCCISHSWWHGQFQDTFFLLSYTTTNKETQHSILSSFLPPWIFSNFVLGNRPSSVWAHAHPAVLPDRT